jgi:hypothetical protein
MQDQINLIKKLSPSKEYGGIGDDQKEIVQDKMNELI